MPEQHLTPEKTLIAIRRLLAEYEKTRDIRYLLVTTDILVVFTIAESLRESEASDPVKDILN